MRWFSERHNEIFKTTSKGEASFFLWADVLFDWNHHQQAAQESGRWTKSTLEMGGMAARFHWDQRPPFFQRQGLLTCGFECYPNTRIWDAIHSNLKYLLMTLEEGCSSWSKTQQQVRCVFSLRFRWRVFWLIHLILCSTGGLAQTQVDVGRWPRAAAPSFAMWTVWSHFCWLSCILPW